ncbi:MAG: hypothetical protein ACREE6_00985 [Limisphaerales bacterium]
MNAKPVTLRLKTILAFLFGAALLSVPCCDAFGKAVHLPPDVQKVLENADTFTLFSINPEPDYEHKAKRTFQDHEILGQLKIRSTATRKELIDALNEGISAAGLWGMQCFNPRHAIRAEKGDKTVELLICFECRQIYITSSWATNVILTTTTPNPAATFNKVLKRAGIPLPKN